MSTGKITITAFLAALFAVVAFMFKGFVIIPGITELRPVNAFPITYGLLFGQMGAVASCLGNIIGDVLGGTLTPGSVGGAIGNYGMAYVPYKVYCGLRPGQSALLLKDTKDYLLYAFLSLLAAATAAIIIPVFTDAMQLAPYTLLFMIILVNNFVATMIIGTLLQKYLAPKICQGSLNKYCVKLGDKGTQTTSTEAKLLAAVTTIALLVGLVFCMLYPPPAFANSLVLWTMGAFSALIVVLMR